MLKTTLTRDRPGFSSWISSLFSEPGGIYIGLLGWILSLTKAMLARQYRGRHEWVLQENAHKDITAPPTNQEARQERGRHEWVQNNIKFGHPPRLRTWWFVMVWGEPRDPQPWRSSHDVGDFRRFLAAHMQSQLQSNWLRFWRTGNSFPMLGTAGTIIFDTVWHFNTLQYVSRHVSTFRYILMNAIGCDAEAIMHLHQCRLWAWTQFILEITGIALTTGTTPLIPAPWMQRLA